jgi:hypothetical protein
MGAILRGGAHAKAAARPGAYFICHLAGNLPGKVRLRVVAHGG